MREFVEPAQKRDCVQVLPPAIAIGNPLPRLPRIVEVKHGSDRIHAEAIDVKLPQPEQRAGDEELTDFVASEVKDQGSPVQMLALARVGMFVEGASVEEGEPMSIFGKVGRDPVHN